MWAWKSWMRISAMAGSFAAQGGAPRFAVKTEHACDPLHAVGKGVYRSHPDITAPPHGFVRPGPFLSPPGHGPIRATARTYGGDPYRKPRRTNPMGPRSPTRARSAGRSMATRSKDVPTMARNINSRRIRKIFGNIHEISEMPNL